MNTTIGIIGKLIKELRSKRGLTLDELAEKSDCTSGFISQLENNKAAPSLTTLYSIAEALGVNVIDFFPSPLAPSKVTRSDNRESFHFEGAAIVYSLLSAKFHHGALGIFLMTYHPADQALPTDELRKHMGEEFVYVLDGVLRLWIGEGFYDLYAGGDSAHFLSTTKHRTENLSNQPTVVLYLITPSIF